MYKIKINENINLQLSNKLGTYRDEKAIEIIGIEINNKKYSLSELSKKISNDIITIAENQMEEFISNNINNQEFFNDNENSVYLVAHKVKKEDRLYIEYDFEKLKENILIIFINKASIYINLLDWTYKTHTTKPIGFTYNYEHIFDEDLKHFIYTDYRDKSTLLLKRQLEAGTAHPVFYECKRIHDFLKDKKTVKMIYDGKERVIKDLYISKFFDIKNMKLTFSIYSDKINKPTEVTLKYARKTITYTVYPRVYN